MSMGVLCRNRGAAVPVQEWGRGLRCHLPWEQNVVGTWGRGHLMSGWGFPCRTPTFTPLFALGRGEISGVFCSASAFE